jgi:hypothetical protein
LDRLREALQQTAAVSMAQGQYDGEIRTSAVHELALPDVIVRIMWRLFDYAALAGQGDAGFDDMVDGIISGNVRSEKPSSQDVNITSPSWDDCSGFGNLPQNNDWLLFGMPWTAYYPDDGDLPSHLTQDI